MSQIATGRFWAIGVGPGDPELLTLKAVRLLQQVRAVYHAGPADDRGRALEVVRAHLQPDQPTRTVLTGSMTDAAADNGKAVYRCGVEQIAADCRLGLDVAFVTEGDPTLYSTATVVWQLLADMAPEIPIEVVPGITSVTAAAARVGWPLARKDEAVAVVPAGFHLERLPQLLEEFTTVCLLKPAQVLPQIRQTLASLGGGRTAVYVENLGTEREFVAHDLAAAADRKDYFSLVLVRQAPHQGSKGTLPGKLWVVGLGPGDLRLLTRQAREILTSVDAIVGYANYLQALAPLHLRAEVHAFALGQEVERAGRALDLAAAGRQVALVSSGDAGIYGMASVLLEMAAGKPGLDIELAPGVTAATAAAGLLGAPLGHDFACISLSDLLTPWEVIERRLHAVGQGDLVLALYNPVSQRRTWQLPRARDILLSYRRPETPVGLVDRAFRPGTRAWTTTLADLTGANIGMETAVIVGNSETRLIHGRMVTPRGYHSATSGTKDRASRERERPEEDSGRSRSRLALGSRIMDESFAIIERELGRLDLPPWAFAVVRRMIHASADFEFSRLLRCSDDFESRILAALRDRVPIVTDTEMVRLGIATAATEGLGLMPTCHLNDPQAEALARSSNLTRSAAGMRLAAQRVAAPILVIGNAPTALEEALRLIHEEGWRPAAILAMPVGFVGVREAKDRLLAQTAVPYLTCAGRKGGSAATAAAFNALVEWCTSS